MLEEFGSASPFVSTSRTGSIPTTPGAGVGFLLARMWLRMHKTVKRQHANWRRKLYRQCLKWASMMGFPGETALPSAASL
jgi:hypothetical protein